MGNHSFPAYHVAVGDVHRGGSSSFRGGWGGRTAGKAATVSEQQGTSSPEHVAWLESVRK